MYKFERGDMIRYIGKQSLLKGLKGMIVKSGLHFIKPTYVVNFTSKAYQEYVIGEDELEAITNSNVKRVHKFKVGDKVKVIKANSYFLLDMTLYILEDNKIPYCGINKKAEIKDNTTHAINQDKLELVKDDIKVGSKVICTKKNSIAYNKIGIVIRNKSNILLKNKSSIKLDNDTLWEIKFDDFNFDAWNMNESSLSLVADDKIRGLCTDNFIIYDEVKVPESISMYCSCSNRIQVTSEAARISFEYCRNCKKEIL